MITVTSIAADRIKHSVSESDAQGMVLRIAVTKKSNGSFHYAMGFDEVKGGSDFSFSSEGIDIVVDKDSGNLLRGMTLDFLELESGAEFVFMNPNDPAYVPPESS